MTQFLVGVIVGASAAGLIAIVVGPSRRVRAEKPLDRDVETKLLLGRDPDDATIPPEPVAEHRGQYSPEELAELRRIGNQRRRRRK